MQRDTCLIEIAHNTSVYANNSAFSLAIIFSYKIFKQKEDKSMKKKFLSVFLAGAMVLSLAACGNSG